MKKKPIWTGAQSILLSQILVYLFALALVLVDLSSLDLCLWLTEHLRSSPSTRLAVILMVWLYACNVPALLLLYQLHRLLGNLRKGQVFLPENVQLLRWVSYCCFAAVLLCLGFTPFFPSLLAIALAAGFMGLIVRIVKNVFQQAIEMKDELDWTV